MSAAHAVPAGQQLRFRGNLKGSGAVSTPKPPSQRHTGILQDQVRRSQRPPWTPSFSVAFRILLLIRVSGAMYAIISDCDETYNYWEPLHYLYRSYGFQTWEYSPDYAVRSWAYLLLHIWPAWLLAKMTHMDKRAVFFTVRITLAFVSSFAEAKFYKTVVDRMHNRVGRYMFVFMVTSAGMWAASTALLPSSFTMYTSLLAFSYAFHPATLSSSQSKPSVPAGSRPSAHIIGLLLTPRHSTLKATFFFALGALVGWPFSILLALPFVIEELAVYAGDRVQSSQTSMWIRRRWERFVGGMVISGGLIAIPTIFIDSLAYMRPVVASLQILSYNLFSSSRGVGPTLYGVSPPWYYIQNLLLNFNFALPLALISLPVLMITRRYDSKRLGFILRDQKEKEETSDPFLLLGLRLSGFYIWLAVLSMQAHKEERFFFPAYPLVCFNAAVTLYLLRGLLETGYIRVTESPYKASRTRLFSGFTFLIVTTIALLGASRIMSQTAYYHAPFDVAHHFQTEELPYVVSKMFPEELMAMEARKEAKRLEAELNPPKYINSKYDEQEQEEQIGLAPLQTLPDDRRIRLCLGKEWHRFPSHFLVPDGINVDFVRSEFRGILPKRFVEPKDAPQSVRAGTGFWAMWPERWTGTRVRQSGFNERNAEETDRYVDVSTCDYLIDLDFSNRSSPPSSPLEPRYAAEPSKWERVFSVPFLDANESRFWSRALWLPLEAWQRHNRFGDYVLLRNMDSEKLRSAGVV